MALDGIFISNLVDELQQAVGTHIDKIYQPSRDELCFLLRSAGFAKRLIISARPGAARIHFTDMPLENPPTPPMFCMLLRKHLSGAKIASVTQDGFERIIHINMLATDEMGYRINISVIAELIGSRPNIIVVGKDGRIIDAVRRSDIEKNERMIQPGAVYTPPEMLGKKSLFDTSLAKEILKLTEMPLSRAILDLADGVSPLIAREAANYVSSGDKTAGELNGDEKQKLYSFLLSLSLSVKSGIPTLITDQNENPKDFSFIPIHQYGEEYKNVQCKSFSALLDEFYKKRASTEHIRRAGADLLKLLNNIRSRADRKTFLRKRELEECKDKEKYRIYGELIKANMGLIKKGAAATRVPNYYDPDLQEINIPLDPAISPAANSAKYFKEYRKKCSAEQTLGGLIEESIKESEYISSVIDALERTESISEINDIKEELIRSGYIRIPKGKMPKRPPQKPKKYISSDGFKILVGRNNIQNDELTLKTASKDDLWLHAKDIHGSHVIIVSDGREIPDSAITEAACLAAYHSKARNSHNVPVDCTKVRYVKKPSGAKPGMVIYKNNKTYFVAPKEI